MATTIIGAGTISTGITVTNGNTVTVQTGGTLATANVFSGGSAVIAGLDTGSIIQAGATETVSGGGSATLDQVYGTQVVSSGSTISNEAVFSGGIVDLATNTAVLNGGFTFANAGGTLVLAGTAPSGGDNAINSGFTGGDMIVMSAFTAAATVTSSTAGGNEVVSVTSGAVTEKFTFASPGGVISLVTLGSGDELLANATTVSTAQTGLNITSGTDVVISTGGSDTNGTIQAGGLEVLAAGGANGDTIYGTQEIGNSGVTVQNETVGNGGTIDLFLKNSYILNTTLENGGAIAINGNATASNILIVNGGSILLESGKANFGAVTFSGAGAIIETSVISAGQGDLGVISGFGFNDAIELTAIGTGASLSAAPSGSNIVETVTSGAISEAFTFAGTNYNFALSTLAGGGVELINSPIITVASGASLASPTVGAGYTLDVLVGGTVTGAKILAGGSATIVGTDSGATIASGGSAIIIGTASGDLISGNETISGSETGATIALGGTEVVLGSASGDAISGTELLAGMASNLTIDGGVLVLEGANASLTGGLSFALQSTLVESVVLTGGAGDAALITGFGTGDVIDLSAIGTSATLTSISSGSNAIINIAGGSAEGSAVESFTFAGQAGSLFSLGSISGGDSITVVNPLITVTGSSSGDIATAGYQLDVTSTGTEISGSILSGASGLIYGTDAGSTVALGGTEIVYAGGSASNDIIFGAQLVSGTASGETLAGGTIAVASGGTASNIVLSGGVLELATGSTLSGGLTFAGVATLQENALLSPGAVISGFTTGDAIDLAAIGTGAIIDSATVGGNTVLTITGGSGEGTSAVILTIAGTGGIYALASAAGGGEVLTEIPVLTSFTAGDIVVGVVGDDNDTGAYGDNQAAPIALEEYTTGGQIVGEMVLPQETVGDNSVISGEYGSSSEGILQLAADGESLVIAGYGVNASTFNTAEAAGGINNYGTAALAQSTSVLGNAADLTPVARVIADISYTGAVDTSTTLYDIFNNNNPRSVATVDGQTFYISGQGDKDGTQGVFLAEDGATLATAVNTTFDTRDAEIYDGVLYVSQNSSEGSANIESFGTLAGITGPTTPAILSGVNLSVTLTAENNNGLNAAAVGTAVALSPEQYFFANATTLYVADGGQPKAGTIGDGGLQKWILNTTTGQWQLAYTLAAGLNLVQNSSVSSDTAGTTGLIGLTATLNADGTVTFYATNSTIGDLDQTYVYTITDTVAATTAPTGESFTVVTTAATDTNDRGISFTPAAPANVTVASGQTSAGLNVSTGSTLTVQAGGTITGAVVLSGGAATVSGVDSGSLIVAQGTETVLGTATGDNVYGTQIVSGSVSNETVYYGATLEIQAGGTATAITSEVNGALVISGTVSTLTLSGGVAALAAAGASISGVTFAGSATVAELAAGTSINGVISGFGLGDVIDLTQTAPGAVLTSLVSGGDTVETITSGSVSQSFTLAGLYAPGALSLAPDASGGTELVLGASNVTGTDEITSGEFGAFITVASGGTLQVDVGATVTQDVVLTGGAALISGTASNDVISGNETIAPGATVSGETVIGGSLEITGAADVTNLTLATGTLQLDAGVTLGGTLSVGNAANIVVESGASLGAVISGFVYGDELNVAAITTGGTLASSTSGGNTIETVTSGTASESFTFAGTSYVSGYFTLSQGAGGETLATMPPTSAVISAGQNSAGFTVTSGFTLDVLAGGTVTAPVVLNGGIANIQGDESGAVISSGGTLILSSGGVESGATILAGGTETLIGPNNATGDQVYGLQQVLNANSATGATLNGETIFSGGTVALLYKDNTLQNSTILTGGSFVISGNATGENITLAGGGITLESPKANLIGTLDFAAGTLTETAVISAGYGDLATIEGFGAGDAILFTAIGGAATLTGSTNAAGNTIETVTSGSVSESFTFGGTSEFALQSVSGGLELISNASVVNSGNVTGAIIGSGDEAVVQSGGTITGATVQTGGTIVVSGGTESGGTITGGTEIVSSGGSASNTTITNGGTQSVTNGGTVSGAVVEQNSTQILNAGAVANNTTVGDPSVQIVSAGATASNTILTSGGEQDVYGSVTSTTVGNGGAEVLFTGGTASESLINNGGTLVLDGGTATDTTLAGGATLVVDTLTFTDALTGTISGGELVISDGTTPEFTLALDGDYSGDTVTLSATTGGVELTLCFYPGTRIATPQGHVMVEALQPGDLVLTANGAKPVRWIGQSHITTRFADPLRSLPVRITQGALGGGLPVRDLLLSPDHAVFIDGVLVQAGALVNGGTIIRETGLPESFTYYHVELETHELLLAEGMQVESFVDNVDRMNFHNWDERSASTLPIVEMPYPRAKAQRQLPQVLRRMLAVAKRA